MYCMRWLGILLREALARIILEDILRQFVFQPVIVSIMNWKSLLEGLLWNIWMPKYLPKEVVA